MFSLSLTLNMFNMSPNVYAFHVYHNDLLNYQEPDMKLHISVQLPSILISLNNCIVFPILLMLPYLKIYTYVRTYLTSSTL